LILLTIHYFQQKKNLLNTTYCVATDNLCLYDVLCNRFFKLIFAPNMGEKAPA